MNKKQNQLQELITFSWHKVKALHFQQRTFFYEDRLQNFCHDDLIIYGAEEMVNVISHICLSFFLPWFRCVCMSAIFASKKKNDLIISWGWPLTEFLSLLFDSLYFHFSFTSVWTKMVRKILNCISNNIVLCMQFHMNEL